MSDRISQARPIRKENQHHMDAQIFEHIRGLMNRLRFQQKAVAYALAKANKQLHIGRPCMHEMMRRRVRQHAYVTHNTS